MGSLGTPCGKIRYKGQVPGIEEAEDAAANLTAEEEAQADEEEDQREGELGYGEAPTPAQDEGELGDGNGSSTTEAVEELEEAAEVCEKVGGEFEEADEGFQDLGEVYIDPEADAYENPWEPYF